jgi:hypothetical protein
MGLQPAARDDQVGGDRRRGRSGNADAVGDLFCARLGKRREGGGARGRTGRRRCTLADRPPIRDSPHRGDADGLVDYPRQAPGPVLVARDEPDRDRDEADRDERDDDVLGQHQTSHVGRG